MTRDERCRVHRCRQEYALVYLGRRICDRHWQQFGGDAARLRRELGIDSARASCDNGAPTERKETT